MTMLDDTDFKFAHLLPVVDDTPLQVDDQVEMTKRSRLFAIFGKKGSRKVRDADGDGLVYEGTPRERPATPAERARGAAYRAASGKKKWEKKVGPQVKKKPAAKKITPIKPKTPIQPKTPAKKTAAQRRPTSPLAGGSKKPKATPAKPASKPLGEVSDEWKAGPGDKYVGARVTAVGPDGETKIFNITGMDAADVRQEIETIRDKEGFKIKSIAPPKKTPIEDTDRPSSKVGEQNVDAPDKESEAPDAAAAAADRAGRAAMRRQARVGPKTTAEEHVAKGGSLRDAPESGNIVEALTDQERFEIFDMGGGEKADGETGGTASMWVLDHDNTSKQKALVLIDGEWEETDAEVSFLKAAGGANYNNDLLAEDVGSALMEQMDDIFEHVNITKWGGTPTEDMNAEIGLVSPHMSQANDKGLKLLVKNVDKWGVTGNGILKVDGKKYEGKTLKEHLKDSGHQSDMLNIAVLDWVMNNGDDRHAGNIGIMQGEDGAISLTPFDHSMAFEAATDWGPKHIAPMDSDFDNYLTKGRAKAVFAQGLEMFDSPEEAQEAMADMALKLKSIQWDAIAARYTSPPYPARMAARANDWVATMKRRANDVISDPQAFIQKAGAK